jgi:hypothetical protein
MQNNVQLCTIFQGIFLPMFQTVHYAQFDQFDPKHAITSGKCTMSLGHPRMAQGALETQRHQRYEATEVAPRARFTTGDFLEPSWPILAHPGSILGHPKIYLWQSLAVFSSLFVSVSSQISSI